MALKFRGVDFIQFDGLLSDDERLVRDTSRKFIEENLVPIIDEMLRFPLPVIAAVNGAAVGLGCSLAVLSDIVLISERAFLADPHVAVGLVAGDGGAAFWPLLTPAGMRTFSSRGRRSMPDPRQVLHGCSMRMPRPPHTGQGRLMAKKP